MKLEHRLKIWRAKKGGMTQKDAASYLKVSPRTFEGWEAGKKPTHPEILKKLIIAELLS